jgi:hypothetical protein
MSPVPRVCVSGKFTNTLGTKSMIECTTNSKREKKKSFIKFIECPNLINLLGINTQKIRFIYLCLSTIQKYYIVHIYQMSIAVFSTRRKDENGSLRAVITIASSCTIWPFHHVPFLSSPIPNDPVQGDSLTPNIVRPPVSKKNIPCLGTKKRPFFNSSD